jgi:hypothetical protein
MKKLHLRTAHICMIGDFFRHNCTLAIAASLPDQDIKGENEDGFNLQIA